MNQELEAYLTDSYPTFFHYRATDETVADGMDPAIAHEIACDDGWFPLIEAVATIAKKQFNTRGDRETIHATQIKEKFGALRIYVNRSPDRITAATWMAQRLSEQMCERCGATQGTRKQSDTGWMKTLCESCGLEWRGVPEEVPVWQFTYECHECGSETPVLYPVGVGGKHGGAWEPVGEQLKTLTEGNIQEVFSEVQRTVVYGNCCVECDAYQGNYYVYEAAADRDLTLETTASHDHDATRVTTVTTR